METILLGIDEIKIPEDRQRSSDYEQNIRDIAHSIAQDGLFHAPIVDQDNNLVAGWCRVNALAALFSGEEEFCVKYNGQTLPPETIPVVLTHQTDAAAIFRIELHENLKRRDLSPLDQAAAVAKLHAMLSLSNPEQTPRDTSQFIADLQDKKATVHDRTKVTEAILLDSMKDNEIVQKAKTHKEAVRLAKKIMKAEFQEAFGSLATEKETDSRYSITCGDGREFAVLDCEIHGLVFDPPYGMAAEAFGPKTFRLGGHEYEDDEDSARELTSEILKEATRALAPSAAIYMFCTLEGWAEHGTELEALGWKVWPYPLIWYKGPTAHARDPRRGPKHCYECILYAYRGDREVNYVGSDVLSYSAVQTDKVHAAEKPVELMMELIKWSFLPGETIVDPTCGSGSTIIAAKRAGIAAHGWEMNPKFADIARARLEEEE